jgi:hypothetical protein
MPPPFDGRFATAFTALHQQSPGPLQVRELGSEIVTSDAHLGKCT